MGKYCYCVLPRMTINLGDRGSYEYTIFRNAIKEYTQLLKEGGIDVVFAKEAELLNEEIFPLEKDKQKYVSLLSNSDNHFYNTSCEKGFTPEESQMIRMRAIDKSVKEAVTNHKIKIARGEPDYMHKRLAVLNDRVRYADAIAEVNCNILLVFRNNTRYDQDMLVGDGKLVIQVLLKSGVTTIHYGGVEIEKEQLKMLMEVL